MSVFWVITPCGLDPEDEDSMFLRNIGVYLQIHKAFLPRHLHRENLKSHSIERLEIALSDARNLCLKI
jgi:hypothetical protein